jgi:hypothetical protein
MGSNRRIQRCWFLRLKHGKTGSAASSKRVTALELERNALLSSLKDKSKSDSSRHSPEAARSLLQNFVEVSKTGNLRAVLKELIQKIIVLPTKGEFEIIWNF